MTPASTPRFEWIMGAYVVMLCFGAGLDNWAHFHGKVDESFFTPWHAVLYGMMALIGLFLIGVAIVNVKKGYVWYRSLPPGYTLSLLGVGLFIIAGLLDLSWHLVFGIEFNTAAYVSPTHLFLLGSAILAGTGPLRSAWLRLQPSTATGWLTLGPMVLSAAAAVAALAMFTVFASPMIDTFAANHGQEDSIAFTSIMYSQPTPNSQELGDLEQAFGVAQIIVQTALIMGMLLLLASVWRLPFGAATFLVALPSTVQALMADNYWLIAGVVATGLLADITIALLRPPLSGRRLYIVGAFVPAIYFVLMFAVLRVTAGLTWTPTLLAGSIGYAAATGLLLTFLIKWPLELARVRPQE